MENHIDLRKLYLFILAFLILQHSTEAQTILSMRVSPSNPTTNDTVYVLVDLQFTSSSCELSSKSFSTNQNEIIGTAHHCVGIALAICDITDTFLLGKLSAGRHNFDMTLTSGAAPVPCTPGITHSDKDTLAFTVGTPVGLDDIAKRDIASLQIVPNPVENVFRLKGEDLKLVKEIVIKSISGAIVFSNKNPESEIDISSLDNGIYWLEVISHSHQRKVLKLIKQH